MVDADGREIDEHLPTVIPSYLRRVDGLEGLGLNVDTAVFGAITAAILYMCYQAVMIAVDLSPKRRSKFSDRQLQRNVMKRLRQAIIVGSLMYFIMWLRAEILRGT